METTVQSDSKFQLTEEDNSCVFTVYNLTFTFKPEIL